MDVGTAGGLLPGVADFGQTSAWDDGDEVTTEVPDGADFDPTSLASAGGDGDDATAAIPTSVWGGGDEATAAILEAVPTRKREHVAAARAGGDTDDGATATADFDPTSAWGGGDEAAAANDFDPTSVWGDGDEVTAANAPTVTDDTTRRCKRRRRHVGPARAARKHIRIQAYEPKSPQPGRS